MRGKITDLDLTNYALNDGLDSRERLYIESMLAVSEECREDIYRGIDLAQMLETGFERQQNGGAHSLTEAQRAMLLNPPVRHSHMAFVQRAAATLAMAACAAFAIANPTLWQGGKHRRSLASVSSQVSQIMAGPVTAESNAGIAPLVTLPNLGDELDALVQAAVEAVPQPSTMCTPPSLNSSELGDFR